MMHNSLKAHQETKDFEEFLSVKLLIEKEFKDGIKTKLLETLEKVFIEGCDFAKSGELMNILLQGRGMLKDGQE